MSTRPASVRALISAAYWNSVRSRVASEYNRATDLLAADITGLIGVFQSIKLVNNAKSSVVERFGCMHDTKI